ncbi:MAG: hypothetical protein AAF991_09220, partial [Pseudomonadota bacterium]
MIWKLIAAMLLALCSACTSIPPHQSSTGSGASTSGGTDSDASKDKPRSNTVPVGRVEAEVFSASEGTLDVGIVVFDEGLANNNGDLFPTVRKA